VTLGRLIYSGPGVQLFGFQVMALFFKGEKKKRGIGSPLPSGGAKIGIKKKEEKKGGQPRSIEFSPNKRLMMVRFPTVYYYFLFV